jgi:F-type H+-transporting ATPase subunit b
LAISPVAKKSIVIVGILYIVTVGAMLVTMIREQELADPAQAKATVREQMNSALMALREDYNENVGEPNESGPIRTDAFTEKQAAEVISEYMRGQGQIIGVNTTMLMQMANFAVLLVLLYAFLWDPILEFLDKRRQTIKGRLDDAENNRKQASQLQQERQDELQEIRRERAEIIEQARSMGEQEGDQIVERARREAQRLMGQTEDRIGEQMRNAREELRREVAELATEIAARVLQREVSEQDHDAVVQRMVQEMDQFETPAGDQA